MERKKKERRSCTTTQSPPTPDDHDLSKCVQTFYTSIYIININLEKLVGKKRRKKRRLSYKPNQ